ncbi:cytochrome c oxidase assembly protein [Penicillium sp. IBT 18751x]|nr:cytochrome c oxidase assembly protein [Penicillium sp. IBT 18751x]
MSRASKLTLAATGLGTAGIIYFVHWAQENDRAAMHRGVERDMEKQRIRAERQADFEMQKRLEEEYLKLQTVTAIDTPSSTGKPSGGNNPANGS